MKRYRVIPLHFDLKPNLLLSLEESYEINPSEELNQQIQQAKEEFGYRYGSISLENKLENIRLLGRKSLSIVAHHNELIEQIRDAFICGNYYPSLAGACALGERILNHLVLDLRSYFQTAENSTEPIFKYKSHSNWETMITHLSDWEILLPEVAESYKKLVPLRHKSIHFNQSLIPKLKEQALEAINLIQHIISNQFSAFGPQPWFITSIPGEIYLKRDWESKPFIKEYYLKLNSVHLGPSHKVTGMWKFEDNQYSDEEITDEQFAQLRSEMSSKG